MSFAPPTRTVRASHFVATELTALRVENRGIALVLVLGFLVVLSGIILAFFSSVTAESSASTAYSDGASAVMLADSTVALAQAQIRDATRGQSASEPVLAWASQPGAIRTYTGKGKAESVYKLYSAEDMVVKASEFTPSSEAIPDDWNSPKNDDFYTDLNAPVKNVAGTLIYPVVDPLASNPTYDPQQASFVEGFSITKPPAYIASQAASTTNNPAPMPVKWLYLLEDGKLVAPKLGASGDVEIENADPKNPIVGRVAFWTDDETAKVNINTASEGVYWDVPRFYSLEDFGKNQGTNVSVPSLALCQPAQKEFQRYPGHPATTSLSAVFGHESLLPIPTLIKAANAKQFDPYYDIAPRIVSGGSRSGTRPTKQDEIMPQENKITATNVDRLYASVDELIFSMKTPVNSSRVPNTAVAASTTPGKITTEVLQRTKFFTTASSSAPETTLYNTPRIAIWPIPSTLTKRTAYDKLAVFCSTIGGEAYYFTRDNHRSLTADFSGRNVPLYRYLQALTSREVPGFGGDFLGKYRDATGSDRDQILTFIYDYIRCTNLQERTPGSTPYTPIFEKPPAGGKPVPEGAGEVMPIQIDDTRGFGRFYSISQAAVLFYGAKGASGSTTGMRAVFFLQFATPMQGLGAMRCNLKYRVKGLQNLEVKVNGIDWKPLGFKLEGDSNGTNFMDTMDLDTFHGRSVGGSEGPTQAMVGKPFADIDAGKSARKKYPFFTPQDVAIPANRKTFEFRAKPNESEVVVEILKADSTEVVQTINLFYPEGEFSVPKVPGGGTAHSFGSRNLGDTPRLIDGADTVVSLEVAGAPGFESTAGDTRMIQALKNVPSPKFREHGDYRQKGVQFAHGLVMSVGEPFAGSKGGTLVTVPGEPNWMANGTQYKQLNSYISRRSSTATSPDDPTYPAGCVQTLLERTVELCARMVGLEIGILALATKRTVPISTSPMRVTPCSTTPRMGKRASLTCSAMGKGSPLLRRPTSLPTVRFRPH